MQFSTLLQMWKAHMFVLRPQYPQIVFLLTFVRVIQARNLDSCNLSLSIELGFSLCDKGKYAKETLIYDSY